jgi:hypothetical protein
MKYELSKHAEDELSLRQVPRTLLESVLENPQQIVPERRGRKAYQSQIDFGSGRIFLLRAIVDDTLEPAVVLTVYRTKRIKRYWRQT